MASAAQERKDITHGRNLARIKNEAPTALQWGRSEAEVPTVYSSTSLANVHGPRVTSALAIEKR